MQHDDAVYIRHMLDTARKVSARARTVGRVDFDADEDLRDLFAHRIQIIGEAASRVSGEFRERHPQIPWKRIVGMRHRIVHDYMDVDYDVVWEVASTNLPELIPLLEQLLENHGGP